MKQRNLCMTSKYSLDAKPDSGPIVTDKFSFFIVNEDNEHYLKSQGSNKIYFIACLQGRLKFCSNDIELFLNEKEVLLIPSYITWEGEISLHTQVLLHSFNPQNDKVQHIITNLGIFLPKECSIKQFTEFHILKSDYALVSFMRTIHYHYSKHIVDNQFWSLKHQEFIYLLALYHQNETVNLFQSLLAGGSTFKHLVLSNSLSAKTCFDLATACGYNLKTFSKLFKKEFNQTVYQWLQQRKAERIKDLISQPTTSFKAIMYEFDFTSASHLNKFCKKYFGDTPTNLRQRMVKGNNI